jgi:hypothetical protein
MNYNKSNDPNEWADKRKAAMERAKQIREERKSATVGEATFQPHINKRPSYLDQNHQSDSLDALATSVSVVRNDNDDIFERPLPGSLKLPSPGSDSLGKEMRKYVNAYPEPDQNQPNFKSKFIQQYQNASSVPPVKPVSLGSYQTGNSSHQQIVEEDNFLQNLRGGETRRSSGPGWNSDFSSGPGLDAVPPRTRQPKGTERVETLGAHVRDPRGDDTTRRRQHVPEPKPDWSFDASDQAPISTGISPRGKGDLMQARSRLSLLKSKLRKSDEQPKDELGDRNSSSNILRTQSVEHPFRGGRPSEDNPMPKSSQESVRSGAPRKLKFPDDYEEYVPPEPTKPSKPSASRPPISGRSAARPVAAADSNNAPAIKREQQRNPPASSRTPREDFYDEQPPAAPKRQTSIQPPERFNPTSAISRSAALPTELVSEYPDDLGEQIECPDCGRKFNSGPYERHVKICKKVFVEKRKVFDSKAMRIEDNPELVKILKETEKKEKIAKKKGTAAAVGPAAAAAAAKKDKWRADSEAFRDAMKAARAMTKALETGGPLPEYVPSAPDPSLVPCPHCGRSFNQKAAERHIPQCRNIRAKPTTLRKGAGGAGGIVGGASAQKVTKGGFGRF